MLLSVQSISLLHVRVSFPGNNYSETPVFPLIQSLPSTSNLSARLSPGFKPQTFPFCGNHCHFPLSPFSTLAFSPISHKKNPSLELLSPAKLIQMEEEFLEEELWDMPRGKKVVSPKIKKQREASSSSSSMQSAPRNLPKSSFFGEQSKRSAPVDIPNWSKVHKGNYEEEVEEEEEEEEEEEDDNLPPHEWLARKMARSQISSSSVFEGAGRTLKGRDQRKVREAVLTKTGFLE